MDAGSVYFDMHHENKNLNAFFGCGKESLQKVQNNPIPSDLFEFSLGENIFDWVYHSEKNSALSPMSIDDIIGLMTNDP